MTSIFGERLRIRRTQLGLSQNELGIAIGSNRTQISRYEVGDNDPSTQVVVLLAQVLDVSTDWLLGLNDIFVHKELEPNESLLLSLYRNKNHESQQKMLEIAKVV